MSELIIVFLGGSIGSVLRYLFSYVAKNFGLSYQGTFFVNIAGCLFLGFVLYFAYERKDIINSKLKLFLTTGIAGGFTTFSTFSYEVCRLFESARFVAGFAYLFASIFIGLFSVIIGAALAKYITDFIYTENLVYQEEETDELEEESNEEELIEVQRG